MKTYKRKIKMKIRTNRIRSKKIKTNKFKD